MKLNVLSGSVSLTSLVEAPGVSSESNYVTITALMEKADYALNDEDASREYLESLKNALDNANNNQNFVQSGPCLPIVFDCSH